MIRPIGQHPPLSAKLDRFPSPSPRPVAVAANRRLPREVAHLVTGAYSGPTRGIAPAEPRGSEGPPGCGADAGCAAVEVGEEPLRPPSGDPGAPAAPTRRAGFLVGVAARAGLLWGHRIGPVAARESR